MTELDTSKNVEAPSEIGSKYNFFFRRVATTTGIDPVTGDKFKETHYPVFEKDVHMCARIVKDLPGEPKDRWTNLYLFAVEMSTVDEIKIQEDHVSLIDALIVSKLNQTSFNGKASCTCLKDLETYWAIHPVHGTYEPFRTCVMSVISLPVSVIAKLDNLLKTEFAK